MAYLQIISRRLQKHGIQLFICLYCQATSHVQISAYLAIYYRMSGDGCNLLSSNIDDCCQGEVCEVRNENP